MFAEVLKNIVQSPDSSVLVTNHQDTNRRDYRHYYMRLTQEGIQLKEESQTLRRDYHYHFDNQSLEMDGVLKGKDFIDEFHQKLSKIAKDIETNKAFVFEHSPDTQ